MPHDWGRVRSERERTPTALALGEDAPIVPSQHVPTALALTDAQLGLVIAAASLVEHDQRDVFLTDLSDQLSDQPTDAAVSAALVSALVKGSMMNTSDVIHRLRNRMNAARSAHEHNLANDLQIAIDQLIKLEHERLFNIPKTSAQKITA